MSGAEPLEGNPGAEENEEDEGQIVSRLRALRHEWSTKEGRTITLQEAATRLKMRREHLNLLELGKMEFRERTLVRLCNRYSQILGRDIQPGNILGFEPPKSEPAGIWATVGVMA